MNCRSLRVIFNTFPCEWKNTNMLRGLCSKCCLVLPMFRALQRWKNRFTLLKSRIRFEFFEVLFWMWFNTWIFTFKVSNRNWNYQMHMNNSRYAYSQKRFLTRSPLLGKGNRIWFHWRTILKRVWKWLTMYTSIKLF